MVTRALGSASSLPTTESMKQQGGCAHRLPRLAHFWARAFVSRVLRLVERVLFGSGVMDVVQSLKRLLFRYFA